MVRFVNRMRTATGTINRTILQIKVVFINLAFLLRNCLSFCGTANISRRLFSRNPIPADVLTLRNDEKSDFDVEVEVKKTQNLSHLVHTTELLDMADECIEFICVRLLLKDLCSFALTCKRAHLVANRHFYRQYKSHSMEIGNTLTGPKIKTKELYARCFKSNIRNIRITSDYANLSLTSLLTSVRINCLGNLRALEFHTINLRRTNGICIMDQLKNLETISFINCSQYDIYDGFLRYCKGLKHLVVKEEMVPTIRLNTNWMLHVYPNLKTLVYSDETKWPTANQLPTFFQLNPHIEQVCADFRILSCIPILETALECLIFCIEDARTFDAHIDILNILCREKRVNRLRLEFGHRFFYTLATLTTKPQIYDRLVSLGTVLESLTYKGERSPFRRPTNHRLENVKYLNIESVQSTISIVEMHQIVKNLSNLREIHLNSFLNKNLDTFENCIDVAVKELKSLETVVVYQISATDIGENSIVCLNCSRTLLKGACPLTIYLPYEVTTMAKIKIPNRSMILVKPISSLERHIPLNNVRLSF